MKTVRATEFRHRFGEHLDAAMSEPVVVEKTGRPVAVLLAYKDYERLRALEDAYWAERARQAEAEGYLGPTASMRLLRRAQA